MDKKPINSLLITLEVDVNTYTDKKKNEDNPKRAT